MELIKYDDLKQHRFVKNERISNVLVRMIIYTATIVEYIDSLNTNALMLSTHKYNISLVMISILSILFVLDIFIEIIFYKKNNLIINVVIIVAALFCFNLIYSDIIFLICSVIVGMITLNYIRRTSSVINKKFIHYSLYLEQPFTNNRNYTAFILMSTPLVLSLNIGNLFWSIFALLAVCYHNASTANYGWSYQQYLKKSHNSESFLNDELKKFEKQNGKIKIRTSRKNK